MQGNINNNIKRKLHQKNCHKKKKKTTESWIFQTYSKMQQSWWWSLTIWSPLVFSLITTLLSTCLVKKKKKKSIAWPLALDMTKFNRLHRVTHTHCLSKAKEKRKSHQKPGLFQMVGQQQQQKPESTMMNYLGGLLTKEEREKKLSRLF